MCDPSKGSIRANCLILTQGGGDKKAQYTGMRGLVSGTIHLLFSSRVSIGVIFPKTVSALYLVERLSGLLLLRE